MGYQNNAKPQVLILSDMIDRHLLFRYSAPYLLAHSLRSHGFRVKVIDWFTKLPDDGMDVIDGYATDELKYVFFCSTFLMTQKKTEEHYRQLGALSFNERHLDMVSSTLWFQDKPPMIDWFRRLKEKLGRKAPDAKIVFGGGATVRIMYYIPELADYIDLVVCGYGELAAVSLMKNESHQFEKFNGYNYWKVPKDMQPFHAYPFTIHEEDDFQPEEAGILEMARGCRFRCKFCSYDIGRSAYLSEDELRTILMKNYDSYGTKIYHLVDNCINESIDKVKLIHSVARTLPFELEWVSYARPEMYSRYPEMIDLLAESGAGGLFYGIETLHNHAGMLCGKGGDKEKFMRLMFDFQDKYRDRIYTMGSFIVGLPGEPRESILNSMNMILKEKPFHYSSFGSMVLQHPDFVRETKHLTFENNGFSMFSMNPERYGITFTDKYKLIGGWKHEHMTFHEANELSIEYTNKAIKQTLIPANSSFDYVSFRGAGYSRAQILNCANNGTEKDAEDYVETMMRKSFQVVRRYLSRLH